MVDLVLILCMLELCKGTYCSSDLSWSFGRLLYNGAFFLLYPRIFVYLSTDWGKHFMQVFYSMKIYATINLLISKVNSFCMYWEGRPGPVTGVSEVFLAGAAPSVLSPVLHEKLNFQKICIAPKRQVMNIAVDISTVTFWDFMPLNLPALKAGGLLEL